MGGFEKDNILPPLVGGIIMGIACVGNLKVQSLIPGLGKLMGGDAPQADPTSFPIRRNQLLGIVLASAIFYNIAGFNKIAGVYLFDPPAVMTIGMNFITWIVAGVFVGAGVRFATCPTTGHFMTGVPRIAKGSLVSVAISLGSAAFIGNLVEYFDMKKASSHMNSWSNDYGDFRTYASYAIFVIVLGFLIYSLIVNKAGKLGHLDIAGNLLIGLVFGIGVLVSGITHRHRVLGLLQFNKNWNPSLLIAFGAAAVVNLIGFKFIAKSDKTPKPQEEISLPLIIGSILFGLGYALGGVDVASALANSYLYFPIIAVFLPAFVGGLFLGGIVLKKMYPDNYVELDD